MIVHLRRSVIPAVFPHLAAALLVLTIPRCGPGPGSGKVKPPAQSISGYVYVHEVSGRIGTKVVSRPGSLALDHVGNLVICDTGNHRLIKVKPDGTFLKEVGGFGFSREEFNYPAALTTSDGVNFYLLDSGNNRIIRLDYDLRWIAEELIGDITIEPSFGRCSGIAVNSFGEIFLSDPDNNRVVRLDVRLAVMSELQPPGGFLDPGAVAIGHTDNVFVVERDRKLIALFDRYDNYLKSIEGLGIQEPSGICAGRDNLLYVADAGANVIRVFTPDGEDVHSLGSTGTGRYQFRQAHSICINREGWIFASDYVGDRVVAYRPNRP